MEGIWLIGILIGAYFGMKSGAERSERLKSERISNNDKSYRENKVVNNDINPSNNDSNNATLFLLLILLLPLMLMAFLYYRKRGEVDFSRLEQEKLRKRLSEVNQAKKDREEAIKSLSSSLENEQFEKAKLQAAIGQLEITIGDLEEENRRLSTQLEEFISKIGDHQQFTEDEEKSFSELKAQIKLYDQSIKQILSVYESFTIKIEQAQQNEKGLITANRDLIIVNAKLKTKIEQLIECNKKHKKYIELIKQKLNKNKSGSSLFSFRTFSESKGKQVDEAQQTVLSTQRGCNKYTSDGG